MSNCRKLRIESRDPIKCTNAGRSNIGEFRQKRINELTTKINRTVQEEKELKYMSAKSILNFNVRFFSNLKLDDEFDRRIEEFYSETNRTSRQKACIISIHSKMNLIFFYIFTRILLDHKTLQIILSNTMKSEPGKILFLF